ncbi:hypothetical protein AAY473_026972 [Plecturocebus cupreus]
MQWVTINRIISPLVDCKEMPTEAHVSEHEGPSNRATVATLEPREEGRQAECLPGSQENPPQTFLEWGSMLGIPRLMGNIRPDSGPCRVPSTTSTSSSRWCMVLRNSSFSSYPSTGPLGTWIRRKLSAASRNAAHSTLGIMRATNWGLNSTGQMRTSVAWRRRGKPRGPTPPHMRAQQIVGEQFHGSPIHAVALVQTFGIPRNKLFEETKPLPPQHPGDRSTFNGDSKESQWPWQFPRSGVGSGRLSDAGLKAPCSDAFKGSLQPRLEKQNVSWAQVCPSLTSHTAPHFICSKHIGLLAMLTCHPRAFGHAINFA